MRSSGGDAKSGALGGDRDGRCRRSAHRHLRAVKPGLERREALRYGGLYETQMTIGPTIVKQLAAGCDHRIMLYQNCDIWYLSCGR
jgi:hypothetical protein